jgi:hypothetical protein
MKEAVMKNAFRFVPLALLVAIGACDSPGPVAVDRALSPDAAGALSGQTVAQDIIIDYGGPADIYAGPGPAPTTESNRFTLENGGLHWASGTDVEYRITGTQPVAGANTAVESSVQTYGALISSSTFSRNDATTQVNACTNQPNTISWASIDGPGGILGETRPCYYVGIKELAGFEITLDSDDSWGTNGGASVFDVADVATHEFGHAVGLGHVSAPRDGCLTMFKYVIEGEIQKRTPGLGDKLGLAKLYGNTNTTAGSCGS